MLSFVSELPLRPGFDLVGFRACIKEWITGSPHLKFSEGDLDNLGGGSFELAKSGARIQAVTLADEGEEISSVRLVQIQDQIEWTSVVSFATIGTEPWVGIRISRESDHPAAYLPAAKRPFILKVFLRKVGGAKDGDLEISNLPTRLTGHQVSLAVRLISGDAGYRLPVLYVSSGFDGRYAVDVNALANDVAGMAHVVVEPDRRFSKSLQSAVRSQNIYGGGVGLYWPDGAGYRAFFLGRDAATSSDLKKIIFAEIRSSLVNRRPIYRCTWAGAQEAASKAAYAQLRASGSQELERYIEVFDSEVRSKEERLAGGDAEIQRLQRALRVLESRAVAGAPLITRPNSEQDFFEGELREVVLAALDDSRQRLAPESRRHTIISAVIEQNEMERKLPALSEKIKETLRGYRSMDARIKSTLTDMGFSISEEGKHYKLVYNSDPRYTFSLPKTGGDHRGGLNMVSDICRRIF